MRLELLQEAESLAVLQKATQGIVN